MFLPVPRAESFLCCFSLSIGVKFTLWFHLARCVFAAGLTMGSLVMDSASRGYAYGNDTSGTIQICEAAWGLLGVPTILVALWAVYNRVEHHVRVYLYYALVDLVIDGVVLGHIFLVRDACTQLKQKEIGPGGEAFACGVARAISAGVLIILAVLSVYLLYIVWSYCEELVDGGSAVAIANLLYGREKRNGIIGGLESWAAEQTYGSGSLQRDVPPYGGFPHSLGASDGSYHSPYQAGWHSA